MARSKRLKAALMATAALPIVVVSAAVGTEYRPTPVEATNTVVPVSLSWEADKNTFEVLSWNLQFAASRKYHFFYDGGQDVMASEVDVINTLEAIHKVLKSTAPDILLFQEIDRHSNRTAKVDQLRWLLTQDSQWSWTSTPYFKAPYVPHPGHQYMGKVHMDLAILSRAELSNGQRFALPLLDEPRWRQMFNLKRALLTSQMHLPHRNMPIYLGVTHLSAFSKGDGTMAKQVSRLIEWIESLPPNAPWILAGDFNLLPPDDSPSRLGADSQLYAESENPIAPLMKYKMAFPDMMAPDSFTYLPYRSKKPDRKLDYLFYGGPLELIESEVIQSANQISDHLPLRAKFKLIADTENSEQ